MLGGYRTQSYQKGQNFFTAACHFSQACINIMKGVGKTELLSEQRAG